MKILDRYILGEFLRSFFGILSVFALLLFLNQVLGTLGDIKVDEPDIVSVVLFLVYSLPEELIQVVPISAILAVMFGIGTLARRKELLAIHASGISYIRLAIPLIVAMVVISGGVFYFGESYIPGLNERARWLKKVKIEGKKETTLTRNKNIITRGKGNTFYSMKSFDTAANRMQLPSITEQHDSGHALKMRLDAEWAELVTHPGAGNRQESATSATVASAVGAAANGNQRYWRFHNAVRYTFDEKNALIKREAFENLEIPMEEDLNRFLATNKRTKEMSMSDLVRSAAVHGERDRGEYFLDLSMELNTRMAFPLASLLLGLIGYTFAVRSSVRSYIIGFSAALACATGYYILMVVGQRLGSKGTLSPFAAAWSTNIIFVALLIWRFRKIHQVPRS